MPQRDAKGENGIAQCNIMRDNGIMIGAIATERNDDSLVNRVHCDYSNVMKYVYPFCE